MLRLLALSVGGIILRVWKSSWSARLIANNVCDDCYVDGWVLEGSQKGNHRVHFFFSLSHQRVLCVTQTKIHHGLSSTRSTSWTSSSFLVNIFFFACVYTTVSFSIKFSRTLNIWVGLFFTLNFNHEFFILSMSSFFVHQTFSSFTHFWRANNRTQTYSVTAAVRVITFKLFNVASIENFHEKF